MLEYRLHIEKAKPTNEFREVKSPYDGSVVGKFEKADSAALEQALINVEESFHQHMREMPAHQRAAILYKVAQLITENHEELALTIAREGGKPLKDARIEVTRAANTTKMSGDEALQLNGETLTMDRAPGTDKYLAYTIRQPIGPVLAISAFNHPVNLICHQVCTAIAAGNSVIVKPASQTPLSCLQIAKFFDEAGLPKGVLSVATASGAEADRLVQDARIRFITFIGGEDVGWEIRKKAHHGVRIALEHGGTATAIVEKNADLGLTIPSLLKGGYYHAGQVCVSTQIAHIHKDIFDKAAQELRAGVEKLVTGDATSPKTDVGPLISARDVERVHSWVTEAVEKGAKLLTGGKPLDHNCYQPTLLANTNRSMKITQCEVFGPVLCIQPYTDLEAVITEMNSSEYSFQAAIYTQDIKVAHTVAHRLETKACMINAATAFRVDWMPFGGTKASGLGVGGTRHAVHEMTEEKLVVVNLT